MFYEPWLFCIKYTQNVQNQIAPCCHTHSPDSGWMQSDTLIKQTCSMSITLILELQYYKPTIYACDIIELVYTVTYY